ncbi:OpgC domain-containing protein [Bradyrhizobium sp. CSA207]|uniref:OpgC domain-containing protein n=1 Tax=Bradyrhizobium sp. CSA207 TaxID=2698826 RepID=UPI0023B10F65|nr:OpgC domain-containing protein [Bradyrhizobium sp. CSA207]MDE5445071.1 OpgC domain-containing protein [Bradyrhizobium sp. CSA207]
MTDESIDRAPGWTLQVAVLVRRRVWEAITVRSALPRSERDVRLDLFRGLANWLIFLGHIPDTLLAWFTTRNYGFSDGADLFVLISGYTATFVFGRIMSERGFVIGATRLLRRVWQLYVAHLLLFFLYLTAVHYLAHRFDDLHLMDQFNVAPLMNFPVETLSQGLVLNFKPLNLDVLPLYIVLMATFPVVLWFMLRWRNAVMIVSVGFYLAARHYGWHFASYPAGVWYFNPFTWHLLFVFGAWLALGGATASRDLLHSRILRVFCVGFLLFALVVTLAERIPELRELIPDGVAGIFIPNDKTNLAPYRVIHLASLVFIVVWLIPIDWPGLKWPIFKPLIRCGQQSLPVFCVGLFLSFIAHFLLELGSEGVLAQLMVGAAGLWIMTIVAEYRTWSKRVDKDLP